MRTLGGFCVAMLFASASFAQYRGSATPYMTGGFPNVVFPAGTPATVPGMTRFQPNVVYPGGGGPQLHVPFSSSGRHSSRASGGAAFAYPVYVGGGLYDYAGSGYADPSGAPQQQPSNVTVVYPPPPPMTATPVIINIGGPGVPNGGPAQPPPPESGYQPPRQEQDDTAAAEPTRYLIAFKDHTIYSAVAYWVEGSTLHYFTSGNVHNQVSLSLVDRDLTARLNKEGGQTVTLPAR
jgi:hypothetical protein